MDGFHQLELQTLEGQPLPLSQFQGHPMLVVNVASRCGLTPQYAGLESLYRQYRERGLVVLGCPCNQFMNQEPGDAETIRSFCSTRYDVTFPLSMKLDVNGPGRHPLYAWLTAPEQGHPGPIRWNFEKFLISGEGRIVARHAPQTPPEDPTLQQDIAAQLIA
jgi:glutathione peroxidase